MRHINPCNPFGRFGRGLFLLAEIENGNTSFFSLCVGVGSQIWEAAEPRVGTLGRVKKEINFSFPFFWSRD